MHSWSKCIATSFPALLQDSEAMQKWATRLWEPEVWGDWSKTEPSRQYRTAALLNSQQLLFRHGTCTRWRQSAFWHGGQEVCKLLLVKEKLCTIGGFWERRIGLLSFVCTFVKCFSCGIIWSCFHFSYFSLVLPTSLPMKFYVFFFFYPTPSLCVCLSLSLK